MQLSKLQKQKLKIVGVKLRAKLVILFGSKVTGISNHDSDLDVAILTSAKPSYPLFKKVYSAFSEVFPQENVDIRFLNDCDPLFGLQVLKNGVLVFGDKEEFDNLKALINRKYVDDGIKYFKYHDLFIEEQQKRLEAQT